MNEIEIEAAGTQLVDIVREVQSGREVVLLDKGRAIAKIVGTGDALKNHELRPIGLGVKLGRVVYSETFNDPLPDELLGLFEGPP